MFRVEGANTELKGHEVRTSKPSEYPPLTSNRRKSKEPTAMIPFLNYPLPYKLTVQGSQGDGHFISASLSPQINFFRVLPWHLLGAIFKNYLMAAKVTKQTACSSGKRETLK